MALTDEQGLEMDMAYYNCPEVHNPEFTEDEHAAAEIGFEAGYKAAISAQPAKPAITGERVIELPLHIGKLIEFASGGYCPECGGWEAEKGRGCTPKAHTKTCTLGAALLAAEGKVK